MYSERAAAVVRRALGRRAQRGAQRRQESRAAPRQRVTLRADHQARAVEPHLQRVAETDERVTREPLAALDALEQKARLERGELHERRHRRVEITGYVEGGLQRCRTPKVDQHNKKPIPGSSGDGFLVPQEILSRESQPSAHSVMRGATTRNAKR